MADGGEAAPDVLERLRSVCLALPEAYEEPAWAGIRWRVRKLTFAHLLAIDRDNVRTYRRAPATEESLWVLTFRSTVGEATSLLESGPPFFKPGWGRHVMGLALEGDIDWAEVAELLTESFRVLAPKRLATRLVDPR